MAMDIQKNFDDFITYLMTLGRHTDKIKRADAEKWWNTLRGDKKHDLKWHVDQLLRLDTQDTAILIGHDLNESEGIEKTISDVFAEKMMVAVRQVSVVEEFAEKYTADARQMMLEKFSINKATLDEISMADFAAYLDMDSPVAGAKTSLSYMATCSGFDIITMKRKDDQMVRYIVGYKPLYSGEIPDANDIPLRHITPLHVAKSLAESAGIKLNGMMLAYLDHPSSANRPKEARLETLFLNAEDDVEQAITKSIPAFIQKMNEGTLFGEDTEKVIQEVVKMTGAYSATKMEIKAMEERSKEIQRRTVDVLKSLDTDALDYYSDSLGRSGAGILVKTKQIALKLTEEDVIRRMREMNIDTLSLQKDKKEASMSVLDELKPSDFDLIKMIKRLDKIDPDFELGDFIKEAGLDLNKAYEAIRDKSGEEVAQQLIPDVLSLRASSKIGKAELDNGVETVADYFKVKTEGMGKKTTYKLQSE